MFRRLIGIAVVLYVVPAMANVTGRYVRVDTFVGAMELAELEVYSNGINVLLRHPEKYAGGCEFYEHLSGGVQHHGQGVVDGNVNPEQRNTFRPRDPDVSNAYVEFDLGKEMPIEKIVFLTSRYDNPELQNWFQDREGWRVVSVLDGNRRVAYSGLCTAFGKDRLNAKGWTTVLPRTGEGKLLGRTVVPRSRGWISLGEFFIEYLGKQPMHLEPADSAASARKKLFAERNSKANVEAFARAFFTNVVDLNHPEMTGVRRVFQESGPVVALDAFKTHLFRRLEYFDTLLPIWNRELFEEIADRSSGAITSAEDLFQYRIVNRKAQNVVRSFPGEVLNYNAETIPWDRHSQRGLLLAYAASGEKRYLDRLAELFDERALFFNEWADAGDRRDCFPLGQLNRFVSFLMDLRALQKVRPQSVEALSSVSLARYLAQEVEEALPAYWRLARTTVFNHQFNIVCNAYRLSRVLPDFHLGKRLDMEARQHYIALRTSALTRDGSMIEVADIGHASSQFNTYRLYRQMATVDRPKWFTPFWDAYSRHYFRKSAEYILRLGSPDGREIRSGTDEKGRCLPSLYEEMFFRNPGGVKAYQCMDENATGPEELARTLLTNPEVRAILDTVYGRGQHRSTLNAERQKFYDRVADRLPGGYFGKPEMLSDCMPYAGIHFIRGGWEPGSTFVEMLCQPPGGSANPSCKDTLDNAWFGSAFWDTEFTYSDLGSQLLLSRPIKVDGQNNCPAFDTKGENPGSKTGRLVESSEKPLPVRFHCSKRFDFQECCFNGAYQNWSLNGNIDFIRSERKKLECEGNPIIGVKTTRQIVNLRKEKLLVVVDRLMFSDDREHRLTGGFVYLPEVTSATIAASAENKSVVMTQNEGAALNVFQFGPAMTYVEKTPIRKTRKCLESAWTARGETVLVTLLEPRQGKQASSSFASLKEVADAGQAGFDLRTTDGKAVLFRAAKRRPARGNEIVVSITDPGGSRTTLNLGNGTDVEEATDGAAQTRTPILRPSDPPSFLPKCDVFSDRVEVALVSQTPDVEIFYTTDGSEPTLTSTKYRAPFVLTETTPVRAFAARKGVTSLPFTAAGTLASDCSWAMFRKEPVKSASRVKNLQPGLQYDYLESGWLRLYAYADRLTAKSSGTVANLFDVSMRDTPSTYAVRYSGFIEVPQTGVYTFYAPDEYFKHRCEPGYDLRVFIDNTEWDLGQLWHARGSWSIPLEKGPHPILVVFADAREKDIENQRIDYWWGYPAPWVVWRGMPTLRISGPTTGEQPIPPSWLFRQ